MAKLTLQFVPYEDMASKDTKSRIKYLLDIVMQNKIVLMQGRLKPEEETRLIQETMSSIKRAFKGIELCTIYPEERNMKFMVKLKKELAKMLVGNREGITILGPASVVKEIRKDPNKIELFMTGSSGSKKKKKK
jgi:hypothetical protein